MSKNLFGENFSKPMYQIVREKKETNIKNRINYSKLAKSLKSIKDRDEANTVKDTLNSIKDLMYAKRFTDIENETYGIIEVTRPILLGGFASIVANPLLGLIVVIVDLAIKDKVSLDKAKKLKDKLNKEIGELESSDDESVAPRLAKLKKQVDKLDTYIENLKTDDEDEDDEELFEALRIKEQEQIKENLIQGLSENSDSINYLKMVNRLTYEEDICLAEAVMEYAVEEILTEGRLAKKVAGKVKRADTKASRAIDDRFEKLTKSIKDTLRSSSNEEIIKGTFPKLSKLLKTAIASGAVYMVNPTIAIMGLVVGAVIKSKAKHKERKRLLVELQQELEICEEKIKDADSNGDREKKYALMKIRGALKKDIDRLKYK